MSEENNLTTSEDQTTPSSETTTNNTEPVTTTPAQAPTIFDPDDIMYTTKAALGLPLDYTPFDNQVAMEINTVLGIVNQLGIGTPGYRLTLNSSTNKYEGTWSEFMAPELDADNFIDEVKTYVSKRVHILFDPPTSSILMDAMNKNIAELEWRILVKKETP